MKRERLSVLVNAYACHPQQGSEPGMGWGFLKAIAKHNNVYLISESSFEPSIEAELQNNPVLNQRIKRFYITRHRNFFLEKIYSPFYYFSYRDWQKCALKIAQKIIKNHHIDVIHQVNMAGFREPGFLYNLKKPFVWGPVGGLGYFPWKFLSTLKFRTAIYYIFYNIFNYLSARLSIRVIRASKAAGPNIIVATSENALLARRYWGVSPHIISEVGIDSVVSQTPAIRSDKAPIRIVWSGLLIPRKNIKLAITALAALPPEIDWQLDVIGKGPELQSAINLAAMLNVSEKCIFHNWIERSQAISILHQSHIFLNTSLRDLTSTVNLEALAGGVPVLCLDHCGMSDLIDDSCGIKIPLGSPEEVKNNISDAISLLWADEALRRKLVKGAISRSSEFTWDKKADELMNIYNLILKH